MAAARGGPVLLTQDEARFPLVPTLSATLGLKGYRPQVGTWDCKDVIHVFGAANVVSGNLTCRLYSSSARTRRCDGLSKTRRLQEAFAHHLLDIGHAYPARLHPEVVLVIDNAPWHRGRAVQWALARCPNLKLYRLPAYSPHLNPIERLWKRLRQLATHNRLFNAMTQLASALRLHLRRMARSGSRVLALLGNCWRQPTSPAP
ncbi:transposase [Myxococcaceae bacterium GXIMD 01537]